MYTTLAYTCHILREPRGVGKTNITSPSHVQSSSYSYVTTDSLTPMHHIKNQLSTPKPPPPPHPGRCPPIHCQSNPPVTTGHLFIQSKSIPTQVLKAMNMLALLLESQSQSTLTLLIPSSKYPSLRKIPSTTSTGLQKNTKNIASYKNTQTQPSHVPQGFDTYSITMKPCKHTCTPSIN